MSVFSEDIGRRRSLYRLAVARNDIGEASALAAYAVDHVQEMNELWIALQDVVVIAYSRPFTANEPLGALPARWSRFGTKNQEVHDQILRMRNELVAHSDTSQRTVVVLPPKATPPVPSVPPSDRATLAILHRRPPPAFFQTVRSLCEDDLLPRLYEVVERELQALFGHIDPVRPFDLLTGEPRTLRTDGILIAERDVPKSVRREQHR
jgi:hypothetical protein